MRQGDYDEAELERQLENRGLMFRFFGKWMSRSPRNGRCTRSASCSAWASTPPPRSRCSPPPRSWPPSALPWYSIMCLPILFTAGMSLMDTLDGCFMNIAYGWAFFNPVRKVYYNLAITGLSVAICFFIGTIEVLGLLPRSCTSHGGFWNDMAGFNINTAGFVIVGMFVVTWAARSRSGGTARSRRSGCQG